MKITMLVAAFTALLLAVFLVSNVNAGREVFVIEPAREVIRNFVLGPCDEIFGNVSVSDGFIDFYLTNPSGRPIFCYNKTAFEMFNFTAEQKGNYTMHFASTERRANVTVALSYFMNLCFSVSETVNLSDQVSITTATVITPISPFDWMGFLVTIVRAIPGIGTVAGFVRWLIKTVRNAWEMRKWKKKYRKSGTPVVTSDF